MFICFFFFKKYKIIVLNNIRQDALFAASFLKSLQ